MMKIANGVEVLELSAMLANGLSVIHPTLIWDKEDVILIDTGLPGQLPQFSDALKNAGLPFERLNRIIITHHDMDHIGSLASILNESPQQVQVIAHGIEKPYIQCELQPLRLTQLGESLGSLPEERRIQMSALYENLKANYKSFKANVSQTVADGEELPYCGGITVIFTPGHTPGHICLYHKKNKLLIAGDTMNVENNLLVPSPEFTTWDKKAANNSLKKLAEYDIEAVICYHGGLYNSNVNQRILELANS
jgi:glyoxylase-like metal-dependent hydrolase (beta-lactamase superfamily II)